MRRALARCRQEALDFKIGTKIQNTTPQSAVDQSMVMRPIPPELATIRGTLDPFLGTAPTLPAGLLCSSSSTTELPPPPPPPPLSSPPPPVGASHGVSLAMHLKVWGVD